MNIFTLYKLGVASVLIQSLLWYALWLDGGEGNETERTLSLFGLFLISAYALAVPVSMLCLAHSKEHRDAGLHWLETSLISAMATIGACFPILLIFPGPGTPSVCALVGSPGGYTYSCGVAWLLLPVSAAQIMIYLCASILIRRHGVVNPGWDSTNATPRWICADIRDIGRPTAASLRTSVRKRRLARG
ncbi:hypothetical protein DFH06DRAFT_474450 [Mycena polygramma]|nr:hypothetical protein DFH06DRAFT_474450 [Mycena polygramma]